MEIFIIYCPNFSLIILVHFWEIVLPNMFWHVNPIFKKEASKTKITFELQNGQSTTYKSFSLTLIASTSGFFASGVAAAAAAPAAGADFFSDSPDPGTNVRVLFPMSRANCCPRLPLNIFPAASFSWKCIFRYHEDCWG